MEFRDIEKLLKYKKKLFFFEENACNLKIFSNSMYPERADESYILKHFGHNSI